MANAFRLKTLYIAGLPLVIFLLYLVTAIQPDLRLSVPELIGSNTCIIILLALIPFLNKRINAGWSAGFILFVAAALRILFLWRAPELSDDIFRYLFDGLMSLHGHNPYATAPADVMTDNPYMQLLISRVNHPHLSTIYPPTAQFVFAVGAAIGGITGMKLFLVMIDLLSCALVILTLNRLKLNRDNAVLYAWHPLPVIEIAASGHIDAAGIFFLFLTLMVILTGRIGSQQEKYDPVKTLWPQSSKTRACLAGLIFALAVLTKWTPLMFLPGILLMIPSGSRKFAVLGFLTTATAMTAIFLPEVKNSFYTLSVFTANWEFSGFIFRSLRALTGSGKMARVFIATGFTITAAVLYGRYLATTDRLSAPSQARLLLKIFYILSMTFLLLTPTLHPWYALYLAAFLPFAVGPAGIVLSWSVFLSYRVLLLYGMTGQWVENDFIPFMIVIGPVSAFCAVTTIRMLTGKKYSGQP